MVGDKMKEECGFVGIILGILGGCFWGLGGRVCDYLFKDQNMEMKWQVSGGVLMSGLVVLRRFKILKGREWTFIVFGNVRNRIQLVIF